MKQIIVKEVLDQDQIKKLEGTFITEKHIDHLIEENTIVTNKSGKLIAVLIKNAIDKNILNSSRSSFRKAGKRGSNNRGMASGLVSQFYKVGDKIGDRTIGKIDGTRYTPINIKNGKLSKTSYALTVNSSTVGFSDRYPRIPYCRTTAFSQKHLKEFNLMIPYIKQINNLYKKYAPYNYDLQKKVADATSQDFVIKGTAFTTATVNRNYRTACHYDAGDFKHGFGNLGVLSVGNYKGAYTVIPKFGIGLNLRDGDVALFDVHELHGNTEIKQVGFSERISVVCYYREKMIYCGNSEYELNRAKQGTKTIFNDEEKERAKEIYAKLNV